MENKEKINNELSEVRFDLFSYPYIRDNASTRNIMIDVIIALLPALAASIYFFGINAAIIISVSVISCVAFEYIAQSAMKKSIQIGDMSAVVTGVLLAMNIPANAPWWIPIFGAFFAIIVIKETFGGIGNNFMNPALGARVILMTSWADIMSNYVGPDMVTGATPLEIIKEGTGVLPSVFDMAIGNHGGVLGETSAVLLLLGGIYLIIKKQIDWKVPVVYIGATAITALALGIPMEWMPHYLLGGGLILGAFFMATDYVTIPTLSMGRIVFALGAGILTSIIRVKGVYPEGVSYAIIFMNLLTPIIDRIITPKTFGEVKNNG